MQQASCSSSHPRMARVRPQHAVARRWTTWIDSDRRLGSTRQSAELECGCAPMGDSDLRHIPVSAPVCRRSRARDGRLGFRHTLILVSALGPQPAGPHGPARARAAPSAQRRPQHQSVPESESPIAAPCGPAAGPAGPAGPNRPSADTGVCRGPSRPSLRRRALRSNRPRGPCSPRPPERRRPGRPGPVHVTAACFSSNCRGRPARARAVGP